MNFVAVFDLQMSDVKTPQEVTCGAVVCFEEGLALRLTVILLFWQKMQQTSECSRHQSGGAWWHLVG